MLPRHQQNLFTTFIQWNCPKPTIFFCIKRIQFSLGGSGDGSGSEAKFSFGQCCGPDPDVFGPPGFSSGTIRQRYGSGSGSGSFYHQAKIVRKTLIPTSLWLFSLKNDVIYLQKASWRPMTKIAGQRHRIRTKMSRIRNTSSGKRICWNFLKIYGG